jgi:hypothetical protein
MEPVFALMEKQKWNMREEKAQRVIEGIEKAKYDAGTMKKKRTAPARKRTTSWIIADYERIISKPYPSNKGTSAKKAIKLLDRFVETP